MFKLTSRRTISWLPIRSYSKGSIYSPEFKRLQNEIEHSINSSSKPSEIVRAIDSIKQLQAQYPIHDQLESKSSLTKQSEQLIDQIFKRADVIFTQDLLQQIFVLNLPTELNLKLINKYYEMNPAKSTIINKDVALIPLRNAIYNADFNRAIKVSDVTVGHPNYIANKASTLKRGFIKLVGTAAAITIFTKFGVTTLVEEDIIPASWLHLGALNSVLLTYIINSAFFVTIVKFGRQLISSGGDYLTWQKGTLYNHWFKHADEMLFASKIMEADRNLNNGELNPEIVEEICRVAPDIRSNTASLHPGYDRAGNKIRLMQMKDDFEKLKFQAYWMTGGDGFEWVEPDQDPAEIQWREHLEKYSKPLLKNKADTGELKWADELIKE